MSTEQTLSRPVSRLKTLSKRGNMESENTYASVKGKVRKADGHTKQDREGQVGDTYLDISGNMKRLLRGAYLFRQLSPTRALRSIIKVGTPNWWRRAAEVKPPCPAPAR